VSEEATPPDTTNSPTDAPAAAPAEAPSSQAEAPAAAPADDDATLLGAASVEAKGEGEAEAEAKADEPPAGAPEKYELALDGVELDPELLAEAEPILRELNLTNEQANALLPIAPKIMEKAQAATMQQLLDAGAAQRKAWLDATKADPEVGGANLDTTLHLSAKALDALGFKESGFGEDGKAPHPFRAALNESGFGNHPDMARLLRRFGEMAGEDGLFARTDPGIREAKPAHEVLYPNG